MKVLSIRADVLNGGSSHLSSFNFHLVLHSHDFLFLVSVEVVHLLDVLVVQFLELLFAVLLYVFGHTILNSLLQCIDAVAARIADTDLGMLGNLFTLLGKLLTTILGKRGNAEADNLTIVLGHDAKGMRHLLWSGRVQLLYGAFLSDGP